MTMTKNTNNHEQVVEGRSDVGDENNKREVGEINENHNAVMEDAKEINGLVTMLMMKTPKGFDSYDADDYDVDNYGVDYYDDNID